MVQLKLTEWLSEHEKGGVTRCPAMMSSIGALCGSQAHHSFIAQVYVPAWTRVCAVVDHTLTQKQRLSVGEPRQKIGRRRLAHKHQKASASSSHGYATVALKNSASRLLKNLSSPSNALTQNTFMLTHTLWSAHTPRKNPQPIHFSVVQKSPPTRLLLQGETFPRRGKKHLVVMSFSFFFHSTFPLRSIPLVRVKTNSGRLLSGKPLRCITQARFALDVRQNPKISRERKAGVTDTLHPTPHPASPNIDPLCVNVWGSVLLIGGVFRVEWICLAGCNEHVCSLSGLCEWSECVVGWICLWAWLDLAVIWHCLYE